MRLDDPAVKYFSYDIYTAPASLFNFGAGLYGRSASKTNIFVESYIWYRVDPHFRWLESTFETGAAVRRKVYCAALLSI